MLHFDISFWCNSFGIKKICMTKEIWDFYFHSIHQITSDDFWLDLLWDVLSLIVCKYSCKIITIVSFWHERIIVFSSFTREILFSLANGRRKFKKKYNSCLPEIPQEIRRDKQHPIIYRWKETIRLIQSIPNKEYTFNLIFVRYLLFIYVVI